MDMQKRVEEYISRGLEKGFSKEIISTKLLKAGYQKEIVENVFHTLQKKEQKKQVIEVVGVACGIGLLIAFVLFGLTSSQGCEGIDCFVATANECGKATYYEMFSETEMEFSTADCVLTKKVSSFASTETEEVIELFSGKEMNCPYEKGNFPTEWMEGIASGMEDCQGELKETIYEVQLAQYVLEEEDIVVTQETSEVISE